MTYRYPPYPPGGGGQFPGGGGQFPGGGGQFPGGGGQFPGGGGQFPGGPGGGFEGPPGPPPQMVPTFPSGRQFGAYRVDPGGFYGCMYQYTYVWLRNGRDFWFYPTFVGPTSVAGYRWNGFRWAFTGLDLNRIVYFQCF